MKMPIPNDWDGKSWTCVQIQWPDSVRWFAILAGFLTQPGHGFFWDERTGSVVGVQSIGREIESANMPFVLCSGEQVEITEEIYRIVSTVMHESEEEMSLCGYNPEAFAQDANGNLWVRNFCGKWVQVGLMDGVGDLPTDPPIDPPPGDLGNATACTKALKLASTCHSIVGAAFDSAGVGLDIVWGWYDFADGVRREFPNINFGDEDLYNMFYSVVAVEVAGLESETDDSRITQTLACQWQSIFSDGSAGITSDQYGEAKTILSSVLRSVVGDGAYQGFGAEIRHIWERALSAIGTKDVAKITTDLIPASSESCACPDEPEIPTTDPVTNGFFMGAGNVLGIYSANDNRYDQPEGTFSECWTAPRKIYGSVIVYEVQNAIAMKDFSVGGELLCGANGELTLYQGTMDYTQSSRAIFLFDDTLSAELYAAWGTALSPAYREDRGLWSSDINTPVVDTGQIAGVSGSGLANTGETVIYKITVYPIYNTADS